VNFKMIKTTLPFIQGAFFLFLIYAVFSS